MTRELQTYRTLTITQREEATVNMVNVNCSIAFFHGIIQPFKLFRTTCKRESRNRVFDRSDRIYIYIIDIIYTAYTCNTGEDITCK